MLAQQKQQITALIRCKLSRRFLLEGTDLQSESLLLERPRDPSHGDVACNIAMQLAKPLRKNPRELAQHGRGSPDGQP